MTHCTMSGQSNVELPFIALADDLANKALSSVPGHDDHDIITSS